MIQQESVINIADNSGAKEVLVIRVMGGSGRRYAGVGDVIIGVTKKVNPKGGLKKGEIVRVVVVRTRRMIKRANGSCFMFSDNAGIVIDKEGNPKGSRAFGPIPSELREAVSGDYSRILSLAEEVV